MSDPIYRFPDIGHVCFFCPLPADGCDSVYCPFLRYRRLQRQEERARQAGRRWLSQAQVNRMVAEAENYRQ